MSWILQRMCTVVPLCTNRSTTRDGSRQWEVSHCNLCYKGRRLVLKKSWLKDHSHLETILKQTDILVVNSSMLQEELPQELAATPLLLSICYIVRGSRLLEYPIVGDTRPGVNSGHNIVLRVGMGWMLYKNDWSHEEPPENLQFLQCWVPPSSTIWTKFGLWQTERISAGFI